MPVEITREQAHTMWARIAYEGVMHAVIGWVGWKVNPAGALLGLPAGLLITMGTVCVRPQGPGIAARSFTKTNPIEVFKGTVEHLGYALIGYMLGRYVYPKYTAPVAGFMLGGAPTFLVHALVFGAWAVPVKQDTP